MVVWGTKLLENLMAEEPCLDSGGRSGLRIPRGAKPDPFLTCIPDSRAVSPPPRLVGMVPYEVFNGDCDLFSFRSLLGLFARTNTSAKLLRRRTVVSNGRLDGSSPPPG
jgi:hypothetical protein